MLGITYDPTRKSNVTKTFKDVDGETMKKVFLPVPYNVEFQLSIYSKLNEDALQIIEQILPYFQPSFKVTVDLVSSIGEKRDIPITLGNITMQDEYEGNFQSRSWVLIYNITFHSKHISIRTYCRKFRRSHPQSSGRLLYRYRH